MQNPIYLDYNATTPIDPQVADAVEPYLRQYLFGSPSSSHTYGRRAHGAVEKAREQVAAFIGAQCDEIIFTGSATEANNLGIRGVAEALRDRGRHIITSAIEHPSVAAPFQLLKKNGWDVSVLPVDEFGLVSTESLVHALRPDTVLVSIMHANNEVGSIQPIADIAKIIRPKGILLHTDASQSAGKIPVFVDVLDVDLLTLAGHKFYAPKGVGVLYVRKGTPIEPLIVGAGHEQGLRPGTENVPGIVGIGKAAELARHGCGFEGIALRALRDTLHERLLQAVPDLQLNGHPDMRLPNTLNISFPGMNGRKLLEHASCDIAASVGSACHEEADAVSGVPGAMGLSKQRALGAIRLSIGRPTTEMDIERAQTALLSAVHNCRLKSSGDMSAHLQLVMTS